jgi:sugar (pentulose or hexulose) kinase
VKPVCFIGVDVGTSGCRAVAVDGHGKRLAGAAATLPAPLRKPGGAVEQDPMHWLGAVLAVLRELSAAVTAHHPRALCLDATSATLLLCAPDGTPLGPALMYNDSSSRAQTAVVADAAPADSPARGASASLAKLLALAERHAPAGTALALHQADWLIGRLRGHCGDSDWNNALKLGFDPAAGPVAGAAADRTATHAAGAWGGWLERLLPSAIQLPRVHAPGTRLGPISREMAQATGLPADLAVCAGTTDSTAAVIAAGAVSPGDAVTSLGSTLVLKVIGERPIAAPALGVYSHRLGDHWLIGGASNSGGAVLRAYFDDETIAALSERIDPGADSGLDYYPLTEPGERFPVSDPTLAPRLTPRPADDALFLHGLLQGIAAIERDGYRLLAELGAPRPRRVLTIGGGAANLRWTAMRARMLGTDVVPAAQQEAAYGAALLALRAEDARTADA